MTKSLPSLQPRKNPHQLQDSPFPWYPRPLAMLTPPPASLHSCYVPVTLNSVPFLTCAFFSTHMPHTALGQLLGWAPTHSKSQLKHLLKRPCLNSLQDGISLLGSQVLFLHTSSWVWRHEMAWCRRKAAASLADGGRRCGEMELWTGAGLSL